jgi:Protein of unknown function (DUF1203)
MNDFRFVALAPNVALEARRTRADAWGNIDLPSIRADKDGAYPCRVCLTDAHLGERLILLSHSPFDASCPYRTVGPIFVHEHDCAPFIDSGTVPDQLTKRLLALRAYDEAGRTMVECTIVEGREIESAARRMLDDPRTFTIHVHNARAGCFACAIRRA